MRALRPTSRRLTPGSSIHRSLTATGETSPIDPPTPNHPPAGIITVAVAEPFAAAAPRRSTLRRPALAALLLLASALPSPAAQSALPASLPAADLLRLEHTTLTMDDLSRFLLTANDIADLARKSPRVANIVNADPRDLQTTVHRVQSEPDLLAAVTRHGFTPDAFAVTEFTLLQTIVVFASGATPRTIAAAHVNPANIALFQQHGPEIMALYGKLQQ